MLLPIAPSERLERIFLFFLYNAHVIVFYLPLLNCINPERDNYDVQGTLLLVVVIVENKSFLAYCDLGLIGWLFDLYVLRLQATRDLDEMREIAARICREYLTGAWKTIPSDEVQLKRIR